jgi:hypothetical protein
LVSGMALPSLCYACVSLESSVPLGFEHALAAQRMRVNGSSQAWTLAGAGSQSRGRARASLAERSTPPAFRNWPCPKSCQVSGKKKSATRERQGDPDFRRDDGRGGCRDDGTRGGRDDGRGGRRDDGRGGRRDDDGWLPSGWRHGAPRGSRRGAVRQNSIGEPGANRPSLKDSAGGSRGWPGL